VQLDAANIEGFHAARAARVLVNGTPVGHLGEVAAGVVAALDLAGPVVAGELDLDALLVGPRTDRRAHGVSRFPAATIDLAMIVDDRVPAAGIESTLRRAGGELLEEVELFDVFRSDALGPGKVSLAFSLRFRAPDRTLTDEEVGRLRQAAIDAATTAHGAELRT
jgi:phenylalanyl-tRNA synthetase beta chain